MNSLAIYQNFAQTKEIAKALSCSDLIPDHFRGKPANVLLALEFAARNDIAPFAAMQSMYVVHGKVGMTAAMAISLARKHNVWKSLKYVVSGYDESLTVTAIATLHDSDTVETTVSYLMAYRAGWTKNAVYKSIPEQMLKYRAATFLIRSNFPEVLFGMQTVEELRDVEASKLPDVTPHSEMIMIEEAHEEIPVQEQIPEEPMTIETTAVSFIEPDAMVEDMGLERDIEDYRGEMREFLAVKENDWYAKIGKDRGYMIAKVEEEKNLEKMRSFYEFLKKVG